MLAVAFVVGCGNDGESRRDDGGGGQPAPADAGSGGVGGPTTDAGSGAGGADAGTDRAAVADVAGDAAGDGQLASDGGVDLDGGDGGGDGESGLVIRWSLVYVGSSNMIPCDQAGTTAVELTMTNMSTSAPPVTDVFPCAAGMGRSRALQPGNYDVTAALETAAGRVVSGATGRFAVAPGSLTDTGDLVFEIQSFELSWSLSRGNMAVACDQVGARNVNLITQVAGEPAPTTYLFPCNDGSGTTTAVPVGTYTIQVQLLDGSGQSLSETTPMMFVASATMRAVLPPITFVVR